MCFNQHKRRFFDRKPSMESSRQLKLRMSAKDYGNKKCLLHSAAETDRLRIRSAKIHQRPCVHSGSDIIMRTSQLNDMLFLFFTFNLLPYFFLTGAAFPPQ